MQNTTEEDVVFVCVCVCVCMYVCMYVCMTLCLLLYVSGGRAIFRKFCINVTLQEAVPVSHFNFLQSTIMNMWPLNLGPRFSGYLRNFNPNLLHFISC